MPKGVKNKSVTDAVRLVLKEHLGKLMSFNAMMMLLKGRYSHEAVRRRMIEAGCQRVGTGLYEVPKELSPVPSRKQTEMPPPVGEPEWMSAQV